ncbi:putative RNA-directed DNA polymerase from transposon BS [Lucilia cuprina]|nr:putative RNA-directed DNA polymerase from transposon BS [Lucilia cuprina]
MLNYDGTNMLRKIEELNIKWRKLKWLIGRESVLSIENNKSIKPIWLYGIQLCGCANRKYIDQIQRFQNKGLRSVVKAPWTFIRHLGMRTVKEEIHIVAAKHDSRLRIHVNVEASQLNSTIGLRRRLKRIKPSDLLET